MTSADGVLGVILAALSAYLVLGGADFGAGCWDLLARGPSAPAQRRLIARVIGPVWEANHVWLILALTATFAAFPPVYAAVGRGLALPVSGALVGIVLRGAAYVYRAYGGGAAGPEALWGRVFAVASAVTPYMLGVSAAGLATGRLDAGAGLLADPFAVLTGALALSATTFLAAVYLCAEAPADLAPVFRRRALAGAVTTGVLALALIPLLPPVLAHRLDRALPFVALSAVAGLSTLWLLWHGRYGPARVSAAAAVAAVLWGWAATQYPSLVVGRLTVADAAPANTLRVTFGVLVAGLVLLLPAVVVLFRVFAPAHRPTGPSP